MQKAFSALAVAPLAGPGAASPSQAGRPRPQAVRVRRRRASRRAWLLRLAAETYRRHLPANPPPPAGRFPSLRV